MQVHRVPIAKTGSAAPSGTVTVPVARTYHVAWQKSALREQPLQVALLQPRGRDTRALAGRRRLRSVSVHAAAAPAAEDQIMVTEERKPGCLVQLTVQVPGSVCRKAYDGVLKSYSKKVDMPGFRKGKGGKGKGKGPAMPEKMIVQAVGGEDKVRAAAVENVLLATLPQALSPYRERLISGSEAIHSDIEMLMASFSFDAGLQYTASIQLPPVVTWTGDYKQLQVEVEDAADEATVRADVDARLREELKKGAQLKLVSGRGLQRGDVVIVNTKMWRLDDDSPLGDRSRMQLDTETADKAFQLPGLVEQLEGAAAGESREWESALPADFDPPALAGTGVRVRVEVLELFEYQLPEMDDKWASKLFPGCTLAKAKEIMFTNYMKHAQDETQLRVRNALSEAVGKLVSCELPEKLVRDYGENEYQSRLLENMNQGKITFEQMEALATDENLDKFVAGRRAELEAGVRAVAGCDVIFEEAGLQLDMGAVAAEYEGAAARFRKEGQEFDEARLREQVEETIKATAVLDWLAQHASITLKPATS